MLRIYTHKKHIRKIERIESKMLTPFKIAMVGCLLFTVPCALSQREKNAQECTYSKLMSDFNTPKLAKELLENSVAGLLEGGEVLSYFKYLKSKDYEKRKFYFKVITNSYALADGAFAEGLGNLGKEYIEHNTLDFARFFEDTNCFTNTDLAIWADIALLEFKILCDDVGNRYLFGDYIQQIQSIAKKSTFVQHNILNHFTELLQSKWDDYWKSTGH